MNLQWKFDAGASDPEWVELSDEERAELRAEGLPHDRWTAQWRDLQFVLTDSWQGRGEYALIANDWADDVAYRVEHKNRIGKLPRLGTAVEFATLAEAQQHAQKMCDDMRSIDVDEQP
jgi:hypothetical protein